MRKSFVIEPIESTRYRINMEEKSVDNEKVHFLNIQDRIILSNYVNINGLAALPMYRALKKLKRGGGVGAAEKFNIQCANAIKESKPVVIEEPKKPESPIMSVCVYINSMLVKESLNEALWLNVMQQILDENKGGNDVKVTETNS